MFSCTWECRFCVTSRNGSVGTAPRIQAVGPSRGKRSFCYAERPDLIWGTTVSYLFGAGSHRQSDRIVYLTAHLNQEPKWRMNGAIPVLPPICLHYMNRDNFSGEIHASNVRTLMFVEHAILLLYYVRTNTRKGVGVGKWECSSYPCL